jgi:hypothetical protein
MDTRVKGPSLKLVAYFRLMPRLRYTVVLSLLGTGQLKRARGGSVVGWGTILQAGKVSGSILDGVIEFLNWSELTAAQCPYLPGDKGWPALKADNLTIICEPTVKKMLELRRLSHMGLHRYSFNYCNFRVSDWVGNSWRLIASPHPQGFLLNLSIGTTQPSPYVLLN